MPGHLDPPLADEEMADFGGHTTNIAGWSFLRREHAGRQSRKTRPAVSTK